MSSSSSYLLVWRSSKPKNFLPKVVQNKGAHTDDSLKKVSSYSKKKSKVNDHRDKSFDIGRDCLNSTQSFVDDLAWWDSESKDPSNASTNGEFLHIKSDPRFIISYQCAWEVAEEEDEREETKDFDTRLVEIELSGSKNVICLHSLHCLAISQWFSLTSPRYWEGGLIPFVADLTEDIWRNMGLPPEIKVNAGLLSPS